MQEASLDKRVRSLVEEWLRCSGHVSALKALEQSNQLVTLSEEGAMSDGISDPWRRRTVDHMLGLLNAGERNKFWAQVGKGRKGPFLLYVDSFVANLLIIFIKFYCMQCQESFFSALCWSYYLAYVNILYNGDFPFGIIPVNLHDIQCAKPIVGPHISMFT
jgi:hypothetical protein